MQQNSATNQLTADPSLRQRVLALAAKSELARDLTPALFNVLRDAGLFFMSAPRRHGGLELAPPQMLLEVQELAFLSASSAWCVTQSTCAMCLVSYLSRDTASSLLSQRLPPVVGGVIAPSGKYEQDEHTFVLSGEWRFGSGCRHVDWLGLCASSQDSSRPGVRVFVVPRADVQLHDRWHTVGLRGTGSVDISVTGLRVPFKNTFALDSDARCFDSPLYRFPVFCLFSALVASVSIGIARRARWEFCQLAQSKAPLGRGLLRDQPIVHHELARDTAAIESSAAYLESTVTELWRTLESGGRTPDALQQAIFLAATDASCRCTDVVSRMFRNGGSSSIWNDHPLQQCLRDSAAASQHGLVSFLNYERAGTALLHEPLQPLA